MRTHLSLNTRDLQRSVSFYSTLLNAKPVKDLDDYALFITQDPGLELALQHVATGAAQHGTHFGIAVDALADVHGAIERLKHAALPIDIEQDEVCCYARQTKVWTTDPDGRRWEVYYVVEESAQREDASMACCAAD
jgi:catechol 2,3-dioxygenase-like lactoylglutathione lyase family enzyme